MGLVYNRYSNDHFMDSRIFLNIARFSEIPISIAQVLYLMLWMMAKKKILPESNVVQIYLSI